MRAILIVVVVVVVVDSEDNVEKQLSVAKADVANFNRMRGRKKATTTKVGRKRDLAEYQALSAKPKEVPEEKDAIFVDCRKSHMEEEDNFQAKKLFDLEKAVEQVSTNSKDYFVEELRSHLESANEECVMLRTDWEKSNKLQEVLCASNESLEKSE